MFDKILKHLNTIFVNGVWDSLLAIVILLVVGYLIGRIGRRIIRKAARHNEKLVETIFSWAVKVLVILGIAQQFTAFKGLGTTLIASSGIIAVVISLTAQETLNDIISGLLINYNRPYEIGDVVKVNDRLGTVTEIALPHTIIKTANNTALVIPNSVMNSKAIENVTRYGGVVNNYIKISVSRTADLKKAKEIMAKAIVQHPLFVEKRTKKEIAAGVPAVNVMVSDISDTGVELSVGVWSPSHDQSWQQLSDIRQTIMTEFAKLPDSVPLSSMAVRAADSGSKKA